MYQEKIKSLNVIEKINDKIKNKLARLDNIPFKIDFYNDKSYTFGVGEPSFSIKIINEDGLKAFSSFDQLEFCEAYMTGSICLEGEMYKLMSVRSLFGDIHPLHFIFRKIIPAIIGQIKTDRKAISKHYEYEDELYLSFMDKTRCYSQAIYEKDNESLEHAQRRKLNFVINACNLKPGSRVLDVGGGWGVFSEYAGLKGINVTSLTISKHSEKYIQNLIRRLNIPCSVKLTDFYNYKSKDPFDAVVILGVMEHLTNYKTVIKKFYQLLKPGGSVYLDASSDRAKNTKPTFLARYVFPGNHTYFCLHEFLKYVSKSKFEVKKIYNDRYSYYLTCKQWAQNLEEKHRKITKRWGENMFRLFQLYLWGSADSFLKGTLDAYRVVLRRFDEHDRTININ
ncbi:MAG: class I SAM-dependent methyltransferase [Spirochaetia bacterium]|nr:class I SAM-dependent methyltransferase [Spirochaetia bacterium]